VAPKDPTRLPLRWEFNPAQSERTGLVMWRWKAYTQGGQLVMESQHTFDSFTDCVEDAKRHGYQMP
jgi:hypothetical protein